jgi:hypothetical protein
MRAIAGLAAAVLVATVGVGAADAYGQRYPYIEKVNIGNDQYLWINVTGNFATNHGCAQRWYARSKYQLSDERTQVLLRMASASFLSRSAVYVWTEGCTSTGYPVMIQLQLEPPLPPSAGGSGGAGGGGSGNPDNPPVVLP